MIIRNMRASFGKLSEQALELERGLNVITLPNEAGKSTWTEFLLAMLYGVDTREKRSKGYVPVKEKYRPWQGGAMQGAMTLELDGKTLTLERTDMGTPKAQLRAFETESGLPVALPEGEACGSRLVHAERSVYERSGFLRQQQHALTQDAALAGRLSALVTTGDERYAYPVLEKALRDQKNRCRSNKRNGLIPETEAQLLDARARLDDTRLLQSQLAEAEAELRKAEEQLAYWNSQQQLCGLFAAERMRRQLEQAERDCEADKEELKNCEAQCAALPNEAALRALDLRLDEASRRLSEARAAKDALPPPAAPPSMPPALEGLSPEEARRQADKDLARLEELRRPQAGVSRLPLILAAVLLLCGAGLVAAGLLLPLTALWIAGAAPLLGGVCCALWGLRLRKASRQAAEQAAQAARELADRYDASPETMESRIESRLSSLEAYAAAAQQRQAQAAAAEAVLADAEAGRDALLAEVDVFGPRTQDLTAAGRAVANAIALRQTLQRQQEKTQQSARYAETLRAQMGDADRPRPALPEGVDPPDQRTVSICLPQAQAAVQNAQSRIDRLSGRLLAGEDALTLQARVDRLEARLAELTWKNDALELALDVLAEANGELQARFAPLVCDRAGELFAQLTEGRYERVNLDAELNVTVWEKDAAIGRTPEQLSAGTVDQLYLALRLAISELLLPDAPLVLDDALVAFDDRRAALALRVLASLAENRQILLFTCQSREARILEAEAQKT